VRKRAFALFLLVILAVFSLVACGGGSGSDETAAVEEVIETSATSTDPADCRETETQKFMEQVSAENGSAAVRECEEEAKKDEGADSVAVSAVEVEGSGATAEAALKGGNLDGQTVEVALIKDGDQWKMDEVVKFTSFDQGHLVETLEGELSKPSSEANPKIAGCFIEAFEEGSQAEVEDLLFGGSPKPLEAVLEAC
jgi:hypothetical protein